MATYGIARSGQQVAVRAELDSPEGRRVRRDDTDVTRAHVDKLDLAWGPTWKGDRLIR